MCRNYLCNKCFILFIRLKKINEKRRVFSFFPWLKIAVKYVKSDRVGSLDAGSQQVPLVQEFLFCLNIVFGHLLFKISEKKLNEAVLTSIHNLCFWSEIRKIMYTPIIPSLTIYKWVLRRSKLYRSVFVIEWRLLPQVFGSVYFQ